MPKKYCCCCDKRNCIELDGFKHEAEQELVGRMPSELNLDTETRGKQVVYSQRGPHASCAKYACGETGTGG